jgi:DNA-binding transcriptional LysR family regulator
MDVAPASRPMRLLRFEPAGLVRVTAVPAFAVRHVLPALTEKYPKIQVKLFCSNRPLDLCK